MLRNYITIVFRNLRRYRSYTLVNIAGLTLGITCGLLIFLLVRFHLSKDNYHTKADRTYRVVTDLHFGNRIQTPGVPYPFGKAFRLDFPEAETVALVQFGYNNLVTTGIDGTAPRKKFMLEDELAFCEPEYFDVFDYQWLKGGKGSLKEPFTAVLTVSLAQKLFGDIEPVGQTIRIDNKHDYKITAILADPPANTQFDQQLFLSYASYAAINTPEHMSHWGGVSSNSQCFVVLPAGISPQQPERRFPEFVKKHHEDFKAWEHHLQPLSDMYFNPDYGGDVPKNLLWALAIVGLLLIGTACINFINLATAQALNRSREVGVRKVLGSTRGQLFRQFLLETGAITLFALAFSLLLVQAALPYVNDLTHSKLVLRLQSDGVLWLFLAGMFGGVTLLAGAYPAVILAGFKPVAALKGKVNSQTLKGYNVRRGLVVAQFFIGQVLIIAALVITRQMNLMKSSDLGFKKDAIVLLPVPETTKTKIDALRRELEQIPGVQKVSFGYEAPSSSSQNTTNCRFDTRQEDEIWQILTCPADDQYLETYDIPLVAGRNLQPSDTIREFLINETAVEKLGLASPEEALGKRLQVWGHWAPVVGVVRNFHTRSLHEAVEPVVMMSQRSNYGTCGVRIDLANTGQTLAAMDRTWNSIYPDEFYRYTFLDDQIANFYELEAALLGLAQAFCGIALLIGCLGLYGLVSFMAARKQREIGIRKVLGASSVQILALFGKEFFRLILLAFILAAPLGWWAMDSWLQDYPYRVTIGVGSFLVTIAISLLIALLTVSAQSLKAALVPPADSLRAE